MAEKTIKISKGSSSAIVHSFGATLTSWRPHGKEAIFVSQKSHFDDKTPIRGGIPVVFPHFGPWEGGPQHGFARKVKWSVQDGGSGDNSEKVTFVLEDTEDTRKIWNFKFKLVYTVSLTSESELNLHAVVTNTGDKSFDFTFLLHTYFLVPDVRNCTVSNLKGVKFIDKVKENAPTYVEDREEIKLSELTDSIYQSTPDVLKITKTAASEEMTLEKTNLPDAVVWNPWVVNSKKMSDFGDDEWQKMICVEAGHVSSPLHLGSGESFQCSQLLRAKI